LIGAFVKYLMVLACTVIVTSTAFAADHGPVFSYATPVNSEREFSFDTGIFGRYGSQGTQLSTGSGFGYGVTPHITVNAFLPASSPNSRRNYRFAMEQLITWYCSEPRLVLNRAVVLRFRLHLESLGLAAGTINQRLAAIRRLAYEAADSRLLSPELAAGIRRVKGVKLHRIVQPVWIPGRRQEAISP
jgi:hypothetical protein